jgi:hypothetical protein
MTICTLCRHPDHAGRCGIVGCDCTRVVISARSHEDPPVIGPGHVGLVDKQFLLDSGLNPWALELFIESWIRSEIFDIANLRGTGITFQVYVRGKTIECSFKEVSGELKVYPKT